MSTYLSGASGDPGPARELDLWDRSISVAFLADLTILEVAMRNAMSAQLEASSRSGGFPARTVPDRAWQLQNLGHEVDLVPPPSLGQAVRHRRTACVLHIAAWKYVVLAVDNPL